MEQSIKAIHDFHLSLRAIDKLDEYIDFLLGHCIINEVELIPTRIPKEKNLHFFDSTNKRIKINGYKLEKQNPLLFNNFKYELIFASNRVLDKIFSNSELSYTEKINAYKILENICLTYLYHHEIEDSISLVSRLVFKITTTDNGIITILTFAGLELNTQIFPGMIYEFNSRKFFFKEMLFKIHEKVESLNEYEIINDKSENIPILRSMVYELAAGIQELNLLSLTISQKKELETKLFAVLNINGGKRSRVLWDINAREKIKAHTLQKMVKILQSKKII